MTFEMTILWRGIGPSVYNAGLTILGDQKAWDEMVQKFGTNHPGFKDITIDWSKEVMLFFRNIGEPPGRRMEIIGRQYTEKEVIIKARMEGEESMLGESIQSWLLAGLPREIVSGNRTIVFILDDQEYPVNFSLE